MTRETHRHDQRSIAYGRKTIDYSLLRVDRKTMEIAVHPDSQVVVKAPGNVDVALIEEKVAKRARWIVKQLDYFRQFHPRTPPRCYVSGETHLYLGRQYRLRLKKGEENSVKLSRGFFHVVCRNKPTPAAVQELLQQWYLEKAQLQFAKSMERCWQKFHRFGRFGKEGKPDTGQPELSIRRMKTRWGSLSSKGKVTLNADLIRAPKECIDYVVMHELCHLKHRDHSLKFYKLLTSVAPDWKAMKQRLERNMV